MMSPERSLGGLGCGEDKERIYRWKHVLNIKMDSNQRLIVNFGGPGAVLKIRQLMYVMIERQVLQFR